MSVRAVQILLVPDAGYVTTAGNIPLDHDKGDRRTSLIARRAQYRIHDILPRGAEVFILIVVHIMSVQGSSTTVLLTASQTVTPRAKATKTHVAGSLQE